MIRSLLAIVAATLIGLTVSRFIEGAGLAVMSDGGSPNNSTLGAGLQLLLVASWTVGAVAASASALLIGERWAPLGWLGAATVALSAVLGLSGAAFSWWAWPLSFGAIFGTTLLVLKVLRAESAPIQKSKPSDLFND
ncbi:MAG: hypothetical protein AAGB02_06875 [Pseudomonadota bacterium]